MNIGNHTTYFPYQRRITTMPYPRYSLNPARRVEDKILLKKILRHRAGCLETWFSQKKILQYVPIIWLRLNPCLYIIPRIISTFASQFMPTQEGRMEKGHAPRWAAGGRGWSRTICLELMRIARYRFSTLLFGSGLETWTLILSLETSILPLEEPAIFNL